MKRKLAVALVLALTPLAWAGDDDKSSDKESKELRDRILKRVDEQLQKEFDRIRAEVKQLLDKELGLEKKGDEGEKHAEKPPEKRQPPKEHAAKPPEEKGTEKPASHEKKPGWLGVQLGQDEESGKPSIAGVFPETPAEKAGLKEGDILEKLNGKDIEDVQSLIETVQKSGAGTELKFTVRRGGDTVDVKVKLAERPAEMENPQPNEDDDENNDDQTPPKKK